MERWRAAYDTAGIAADSEPPPALVTTGLAALVVSSDLRRAIASAELLAGDRRVIVSDLLRELALPVPRRVSLTLPLGIWGALIHLQWLHSIMRGTDASSADRERAAAAAEWLIDLTHKQSAVVAVTHGVFRRLIAARLQSIGWRPGERRRGFGHWSVWSFYGD